MCSGLTGPNQQIFLNSEIVATVSQQSLLIFCSSANTEQVELMDLERDSIRVAEYLMKFPSLELLRERLHRAIQSARERGLPDAAE